jgi:hypothetical protein
MNTERVTIYLTDGRIIEGVRRYYETHIDYADMRGNALAEDDIAEVRDAG